MKILTQSEFDALSDGPHDARVVGLPPEYKRVMVWVHCRWFTACMYIITIIDCSAWEIDSLPRRGVGECPIWHKLPADYAEPE